MWKIFRFMRTKDRWYALLCLLLVAGQVWVDLTMPDFMSDITRLIVTPGSAMGDIWIAGGKMLLCALGSAALSIIVGYFAAKLASNFSFTIREKVFHQVTDFGAEEIKRFSTASLITRTTNDITQIQMLVAMGLQVMIKAPIMAVWAILKIVGKNWQLSLVTAAAVVIIMTVILLLMAYCYFIWRGIRIALYAPDQFSMLLASGIVCMVAIQVILNIAVVTASMPPTGINLPFISYGGNGLLIFMFCAGIMLNISRYASPPQKRERNEVKE